MLEDVWQMMRERCSFRQKAFQFGGRCPEQFSSVIHNIMKILKD